MPEPVPSAILNKAMTILDDALSSTVVDPVALDVAIKMTQYMWMAVYSDHIRDKQIIEAARNKWDGEIKT